MSGNQLWVLPIGEAAQWLAATAAKVEPSEATVLSVIFNTRAMLEISESQKATAESLVVATHGLVEQTNRLVKATLWVAGLTALTAVAAVAAVVIALGR
jgi:hypothetical protein